MMLLGTLAALAGAAILAPLLRRPARHPGAGRGPELPDSRLRSDDLAVGVTLSTLLIHPSFCLQTETTSSAACW